MTSVLHLDLGAGPERIPLGGSKLMRRPAQQYTRPAALTEEAAR